MQLGVLQTHFIVSSRATGSLSSSLNAGMIKDRYFSAGSKTEGHLTYNKLLPQESVTHQMDIERSFDLHIH